jgi:hypothetical protein
MSPTKRISAEQRVIEYFRNESLEKAETLLEIVKWEVKDRQKDRKPKNDLSDKRIKDYAAKELKKLKNPVYPEPTPWAEAKEALDKLPKKEVPSKFPEMVLEKEFEVTPV